MWKVHIRQHECGLLFCKGEEVRWLPPGEYRIWRPWRTRIEKVNRLETRFDHPCLDVLLRSDTVRAQLTVVDLNEWQRALVWRDAHLAYVVGPGRYAFWCEPCAVTVEVHDVSEIRLEHPRVDEVARHADACTLFSVVNVSVEEELLLFRDGVLLDTLGPGPHVLWQTPEPIRWKIVERSRRTEGKEQRSASDSIINAARESLAAGHRRTPPFARRPPA